MSVFTLKIQKHLNILKLLIYEAADI